jgi:hypothetical protein
MPRRAHGPILALLAALAIPLAGCFDEPPVEDRWTRVDLAGATFTPGAPLVAGAPCSVSVRMTITYRAIVTGYSVTELRASTMSPLGLTLGIDAPREPMAQDVDALLANSVTMGRSVRAITGWHHLIQPFDAAFSAWVPTGLDSASGGTPGAPVYVYLVSYLGSGEEVELENGMDSVVVTPFASSAMQILPVGLPVAVGGTP